MRGRAAAIIILLILYVTAHIKIHSVPVPNSRPTETESQLLAQRRDCQAFQYGSDGGWAEVETSVASVPEKSVTLHVEVVSFIAESSVRIANLRSQHVADTTIHYARMAFSLLAQNTKQEANNSSRSSNSLMLYLSVVQRFF